MNDVFVTLVCFIINDIVHCQVAWQKCACVGVCVCVCVDWHDLSQLDLNDNPVN